MGYDKLSSAPITEAVLDVWAELPPETTHQALRGLKDALGAEYEKVEEQRQFVGSIGVGPDGSSHAQSRQRTRGYLFTSKDGLNIAQVRFDGFSLNRLRPYDRWATFKGEAQRIWELYRSALGPVRVPRLGLRYINRIELPPNPGDMKRYFRTFPEVSPGLPQSLAGFMMRLVIPMDDEPAHGIVTQGLEQPTQDGKVPIVFDVEVRFERAFDPADPGLWDAFEVMRRHKNRLFFESITELVEGWYRD